MYFVGDILASVASLDLKVPIIFDKTLHTNKGMLLVMYYRPFDKSMDLWIINKFWNKLRQL